MLDFFISTSIIKGFLWFIACVDCKNNNQACIGLFVRLVSSSLQLNCFSLFCIYKEHGSPFFDILLGGSGASQ